MKVADLYVRVSTDEQADKGYSQRGQEEMLRRYCEIQSISVRKVILEDLSAKTFNRPEWNKMLRDLRTKKNEIGLILFTKWDRFSRNAGDAYQMISQLWRFGVEPYAIEQPLDLSIPENKMMLAFYLAAPEVENDRRALNTFFGMRRAKKEGRYMGIAPTGYVNKVSENGKKYIALQEPQASIMKWVFGQLANGNGNPELLYRQAREKGLTCAKSNFWMNIRSPLYCGKIFIPKYKEEEARFVPGQHEPLISEALFNEVQDILDGRKRRYNLRSVADSVLPLRGHLICSDCGKLLTGSKSKGRSQDYFYYHRYGGCKCRFRAENVNQLFSRELKKYVPRPEIETLYETAIIEAWNDQTKNLRSDKKEILTQMKELETKLAYIRDLLVSQKIDPDDYRIMKAEYAGKLDRLETKLADSNEAPTNIDKLLGQGVNTLFRIDRLYEEGSQERKNAIIGSMYPEKLTFDGFVLRTARVNEVARLIYTLDEGFSGNKKGQKSSFSLLSCEVTPSGFELFSLNI
jgi:site-specific DNA recombinase